jgi:hypothetical protein
MDLDNINQIVGTVSGIITIILAMVKIFPGPYSQLVKLIIAVGIVASLYGGVRGILTVVKYSEKQSCMQGYDPNYNDIDRLCDKYVNSKYGENDGAGFIAIGAGFILMATAVFINNYNQATLTQFVFEIIWLGLGIWLIFANL